MNFVSYSELQQDTEKLCEANPQWRRLSGVIGIPKSGMIPASQIAMRYNLPLTDIHSFLNNAGRFYPSREGQTYGDRAKSQGVLIVDDSSWSGNSLKAAIQELSIHPLLNQVPVEAVTIYGNPSDSIWKCFRSLDSPRIFEWNWTRNAYLQEIMLDLDGVLCNDPDPQKTRDKSYYNEWILDPVPKHLPLQEVRAIVSARLEQYRPETEAWLEKYKIRYQELVLLNCTEQERHERNLHAEHKVAWFSNSNSPLFIESDFHQAQHIHRRVSKAVLCPATSNHQAIFFRGK